MYRVSVLVVAVAALAVACGGGAGAGTTPEATFKAAQKAAGGGDWGAFWDLLAEEGQKEFENDFESAKRDADEAAEALGVSVDELKAMELRDFFIAFMEMMEKEGEGDIKMFAEAEIVETKEEGDKAEVIWKNGDEGDNTRLKKVDGKWLIVDLG